MDKTKEKIPILRRVWVPREFKNSDGSFSLRATDGEKYVRGVDGSIRRATPKLNGKEARRIRRELRGKK